MNLSELSIIIQNLKAQGFTSVMEKFIAVVLALIDVKNLPLPPVCDEHYRRDDG